MQRFEINIWQYPHAKEFIDGEENDIQVSVNSNSWASVVQEICTLGLGETFEVALELLPENTPYNYDDKIRTPFHDDSYSFKRLKLSYTQYDIAKENVIEDSLLFEFGEKAIQELSYNIAHSTRIVNLYDTFMDIELIKESKHNSQISKLVFWGNDNGNPQYIP